MSDGFITCSPCLYIAGDFTSCREHYNNEAIKSAYTHRIMCITDGACELEFCTETEPTTAPLALCKGDLLFLLPGECYRILNRRGDFSVMNLFFDFDRSRVQENFPRQHRLMSGFDRALCSKKHEFTDTRAFDRSRVVMGLPDSIGEVSRILSAYRSTGGFGRARAEALLFALLCRLAREAHEGTELKKGREIADYILEVSDKPLDCAMLAKHFGYHPTHITRLLKQAVGMTPHEFIIRAKLDRAAQLLCETRLSVTAVALLLGFSDSSHFAKVFRRYMGSSPTEYRSR